MPKNDYGSFYVFELEYYNYPHIPIMRKKDDKIKCYGMAGQTSKKTERLKVALVRGKNATFHRSDWEVGYRLYGKINSVAMKIDSYLNTYKSAYKKLQKITDKLL